MIEAAAQAQEKAARVEAGAEKKAGLPGTGGGAPLPVLGAFALIVGCGLLVRRAIR